MEGLLEVWFRVDPASHSIAEEDEVLDYPGRIDLDHVTHPAECRVLFVIVSDGTKGGTPALPTNQSIPTDLVLVSTSKRNYIHLISII